LLARLFDCIEKESESFGQKTRWKLEQEKDTTMPKRLKGTISTEGEL